MYGELALACSLCRLVGCRARAQGRSGASKDFPAALAGLWEVADLTDREAGIMPRRVNRLKAVIRGELALCPLKRPRAG